MAISAETLEVAMVQRMPLHCGGSSRTAAPKFESGLPIPFSPLQALLDDKGMC